MSSPKGIVVKFKSMLGSFVALLAVAGTAIADEATPFTINGELRVRNESDGRDFNSTTDMKSFNVMRTRIGITMRPANDMSVFMQMQDSRLQGQASTVTTDPSVQEDGKLDLHQGYFQVNNLGWQGFGIQAGRMEVRFGNERLIGVDDWSNVTRSFDGGMANVNHGRLNAQFLFANLNEADDTVIGSASNQNKGDATMQAAYGMITVNEQTTADLFVINARDKQSALTPDDDLRATTFGSRVHGNAASMWDYSVEGAWQMGTIETGPSTSNDIAAYMFGGEVGVTMGGEARPVRFGAGFDFLSGDDNVTDTDNKAFNTLFGDNHTFYGLADIVGPGSSNSSVGGLQDVKVNAKATVWSNASNVLKLGGEFHNLRLAEAGTGSNALGNEIDVHATWAYRERFTPVLGMSAFIPGDAIPGPTVTTSADNSYWFYAQGSVSF